jgi:dTDP-glucose pyrophosphorylase
MNYSEYIINDNLTGRDVLVKLENLPDLSRRNLFVINQNNVLVGSITDGDIRRGLLKGLEIDKSVQIFMNIDFKYLNETDNQTQKIKSFRELDIELIPLLDSNKRLIKILDLSKINTVIPISAIIMAGGRGERLRPLTDTVPKPMLQVGIKPIIEHNIDRLIKFGVNEIYISVKYLSNVIKEYFGDGSNKGIQIFYIDEDEPLGTIGAIGLIEDVKNDTVLVMNSDILTNIDYEDFYNYYIEKSSNMCIASIPYQINIPYAVLELNNDRITSFSEKPTYTYYSNGGIYLLNKQLLKRIPKNVFYNATDLMEDLIKSNFTVNHYPLLNYWLDIGKHQDFAKAQEDIKHISF